MKQLRLEVEDKSSQIMELRAKVASLEEEKDRLILEPSSEA